MRAGSIALALVCAACGGSRLGGDAATDPGTTVGETEVTSGSGESGGLPGATTDTGPLEPPVGTLVATLSVESGAGPATFGHVFRAGDVPATQSLSARFSDDPGVAVPLQIDVKASHADASLRHAVITADVGTLETGQVRQLELVTAEEVPDAEPVGLDELLATSFDAEVEAVIGGTVYRASARGLLDQASPTWLAGPLVTEWVVASPLVADDGAEHAHLVARFDIRAYRGIDMVRADVVIENNWSFVASPGNVTYDAEIRVGGEVVEQHTDLTHFHHARWRSTAWWSASPTVHVGHDPEYLAEAGAIPNYDLGLVVPEPVLEGMESDWAAAPTGPMELGLTSPGMPAPGARPDIGPLPRWAARYALSMDRRAKTPVLGTADLAGSWSIHYRDQATDLPVSLDDHPNTSLLAQSAAGDDAFAACGSQCSSPYNPDSAHQPSLAYLPYVVTGDRYYLEELLFWANWNIIRANPGSREQDKGLVRWEQVRGQAWSLRTLAHAAFIAPDDHPLRTYFEDKIAHNLAWYRDNYLDNPQAPTLGFLEARTYGGVGIVPWMDDFFTHTLAWMVAMGFEDARPMLEYKAQFPVGRMVDPEFCWVWASLSAMFVRDADDGPYYPSFGEVYQASAPPEVLGLGCGSEAMAAAGGLPPGAMDGYPFSPTGYPSNLQPALAAAVDAEVDGAMLAWELFIGRDVQPEYADYPNYAIVPAPQHVPTEDKE